MRDLVCEIRNEFCSELSGFPLEQELNNRVSELQPQEASTHTLSVTPDEEKMSFANGLLLLCKMSVETSSSPYDMSFQTV